MTAENFNDIIVALKSTLNQMGRWGCRGFDPRPESLAMVAHWSRPDDLDIEPRGPENLDFIRRDLGDCQRCSLAAGRTHIVFGNGESHARLVFVGDGPGADEDLHGAPFVGAAGQLLSKIIHAMNLSRDKVYLCNVIKCRPPGNRDPEPDEIQSCRPFLERQLEAIDPDVICTLGTVATRTLLDTQHPISKMRGRFHAYKNAKVMPTFHPAFLLSNPDQKRFVWEDMKKIMALLGIPLPRS